ncbi:hypothetical protein B0H14DRAFT_3683310 [Mycena olivaceomarginata]|nr:hypothetical protein B0H14DRAFT_3683310 [Mycena olivaceomarginata]
MSSYQYDDVLQCAMCPQIHYTLSAHPYPPAAAATPRSRDAFVCTRVAPLSSLADATARRCLLLSLCPRPFHATPSPALQYAVTHSAPRRRPFSATLPPLLPSKGKRAAVEGMEAGVCSSARPSLEAEENGAAAVCVVDLPPFVETTLSYQNTKDDAYIQSLPNGEIISFKARGESSGTEDHSILWGLKFNNTQCSVAIFDVLRNPTHHNTFVSFSPAPSSPPSSPNSRTPPSMDQLPHLQSAYIGLVEETGSLFAMSPDRFPLVVFSGGGGARKNRVIKVIDEGWRELPSDVDAITEERKRREKAMKERNYGSEDARCLDRSSLYTDRRCLVGIRPLEGGDGDGPENRLKRLIGGAPTVVMDSAVMHWDPRENANTNTNIVANGNGTPDGAGDKPGPRPALPGNSTLIEGREPAADDLSFWPSIVFAFVVGALGLWFGFGLGKVRRSSPRSVPVIVDVPTAAISVLAAPPTPTLPPARGVSPASVAASFGY